MVTRTEAAIVVGIDGSPSGWDAFDWALGESTRLPAELIAVHVRPVLEPFVAVGVPFAHVACLQASDQVAEQLYSHDAPAIVVVP
jgi:nucleotide-binding universal stress UspA family protein